MLPLTVKQISESYRSDADKSNFVIDGIEVNNVRLLGMVMNIVEKIRDVSFNLDDGTGRIEVCRWLNDAAESNEVAAIQNGIHVQVHGHLKSFQGKSFQGKKHAVAFSVRPVIDFNEIAYHYIECIHVHTYNKRLQFSVTSSVEKSSDFDQMVLATFLEPKALASECGLHVDYIAQLLGVPKNKIMESINYHTDMGNIYSTIDDYHFKSAHNG
ncbi:replication protein A 32 kDa subunit B-like isoform X2 [Tasmannia lanceolata]